ncbi:four-carbon acid sugar kinase family protein [Nonomuraea sp. K274]|uniref:Four-carbon acid sugar kinase family protein n=1 Tax=Nonomuraea cypriaca TaxID=1187855 RepID=A0A931AFX4_9ACTN|nr:four-carbon acid sugar kinase family protein [Nonomuraea cypriaca]MBF8189400.1 four-carbon acid sugar kinase family protein [Nonomuraea cypriaca]
MIGAIADDVTGATDVAVALRRRGIRTVLFFGTPPEGTEPPEHDAIVIALKTRTIPKADAVAQSLAALAWLRTHGARQVYFKYCSTFDSTAEGNIGPVLDALADAMDVPVVAMTPSSPEHGRTQYNGYLFVGEVLLSESHMRHHPLTPMTDSFLPRVLDGQSAYRAGVVTLPLVREGAIERRLAELASQGIRYALVDAIDDADLLTAGRALATAPLVAGAAGLAGGLAATHPQDPAGPASGPTATHPQAADGLAGGSAAAQPGAGQDGVGGCAPAGPAAVLAGSCSARTLEQVAAMIAAGRPAYRLDALADPDPGSLARSALAWYDALPDDSGAPLVYSSAEPVSLRRVQEALGSERSAAILESALGRVAQGLVERGVTRVISAGGETSGAVVSALGVPGGMIGPEAARGVPWILTTSGLSLLLKSGNFGEPGLLLEASR